MIHLKNLDLPLFEPSHRTFVAQLSAWMRDNLPAQNEDHSLDTCRRLIRVIGQGGWIQTVMTRREERIHPDVRLMSLARRLLSQRNGLADFVYANQLTAIFMLQMYGSDEHRQMCLPRILAGEFVAAVALSEALWDGDLSTLKCRAVREGGHWLLNGQKNWVSLGELADIVVVFAQTEEGPTTFAISSDTPGVNVVERMDTLDGYPVARLAFEDVRLPQHTLLNGVGRAYEVVRETTQLFEVPQVAAGMGLGQRAVEDLSGESAKNASISIPLLETSALLESLSLLVWTEGYRQDKNLGGEFDPSLRAGLPLVQRTLERIAFQRVGRELLMKDPLEKAGRQLRGLQSYIKAQALVSKIA